MGRPKIYSDEERKQKRAKSRKKWKEGNQKEVVKYQRNYYEENKEKILEYYKEHHKIRRYGITLEKYGEMLEEQEGKCKICGRHHTEFKRGLHIDHDHETGEVRGLLCTNCNRALGCVYDNPVILLNAVEYLKVHKFSGLS